MNEPPVTDNLVDEAAVQSRNKIEKSLSDRILGYAFVGSVVINIVWVVLVSNSNLFGKGGVVNVLHEQRVKTFKPIPVKPHKVKPPPPPPKPKLEKIKPITHPRPTPPQPQRHQVSVRTATNKHTTSTLTAPPAPPAPATPFTPTPPGVPPTPPAPPAPPTPPAPPAPPANPPAPPANPPAPPPPPPPPRLPPPPPPRPRNYSPIAVQEASYPDGLGGDVSAEGIDPAPTGNKVVIAFTIDETGHFRNVHVRESCGSSELDNRFLEAVRRGRGTPAIQDHIPRDQPESISFSVNT